METERAGRVLELVLFKLKEGVTRVSFLRDRRCGVHVGQDAARFLVP